MQLNRRGLFAKALGAISAITLSNKLPASPTGKLLNLDWEYVADPKPHGPVLRMVLTNQHGRSAWVEHTEVVAAAEQGVLVNSEEIIFDPADKPVALKDCYFQLHEGEGGK